MARKDKLRSKKMPFILILAEIILAFFLLRYMYNIDHLIFSDTMPVYKIVIGLLSLIYTLFVTILTVNAMIGIPSARPTSWRKVIRSSIFLLITAALTNVLDEAGIMAKMEYFPAWVAVILFVIAMSIMFLPSVRRYYTPPMYDVPPLKRWIMYAIATPLIGAESYRLTYDGEEGTPEETGTVCEVPSEE